MFTEWWFYTLAGLLGFLMATEWEPLIWVVEKIDRAVHRKERAEKERKEKERKEFVETVRGMRASDFWWFGSVGDAEVALLWRKMHPPISLVKQPKPGPEPVLEPEEDPRDGEIRMLRGQISALREVNRLDREKHKKVVTSLQERYRRERDKNRSLEKTQ